MRWKSAFAILLAPGLLAGCSDGTDPFGLYPEPTTAIVAPLELTGRVVDAADVIPASKEVELTQRLEVIERETLAQVVIVTTPSLGGSAIADYSLALGRGWKIGDKDRNDGVILLVAPADRQTRIEVGYGLEDVLTFNRSKQIVDTMLLRFRNADYVEGIEAGIEQIDAELRLETETETKLAA